MFWRAVAAFGLPLSLQSLLLRHVLPCGCVQDEARCAALHAEFDGIQLDYSRQRVTPETLVRVRIWARLPCPRV